MVLCPAVSVISMRASYEPSRIVVTAGSKTADHFPFPSDPLTLASLEMAVPLPSVRFKVTFTLPIEPSSVQLPFTAKSPRTIESTGGLVISSAGGSVSTAEPRPISQDVKRTNDIAASPKIREKRRFFIYAPRAQIFF